MSRLDGGQVAHPQLFTVHLTTMHGNKMLLKSDERPQGDNEPAFVQEWAVLTDD